MPLRRARDILIVEVDAPMRDGIIDVRGASSFEGGHPLQALLVDKSDQHIETARLVTMRGS